jgi:predicted membrane protein
MTDDRPTPVRLGRIVAGSLLVVIGVLWFIDAFGNVDLPWRIVLPCALMIVGTALVYGSRTGHHGGLITFGVFLTIAVVLSSAIDVLVDVPFSGGVGDESLTPTGLAATEYHWAIGSMKVDFTQADFPTERIGVTVGIGELVVTVPEGVAVDVHARAGLGQVVVFGHEVSGVSPEDTLSEAGATLHLDVRVGLGRVEVKRG